MEKNGCLLMVSASLLPYSEHSQLLFGLFLLFMVNPKVKPSASKRKKAVEEAAVGSQRKVTVKLKPSASNKR